MDIVLGLKIKLVPSKAKLWLLCLWKCVQWEQNMQQQW